MCLVVLVPFIPGMHAIEISRFARSVFILPIIGSWTCDVLLEVEKLLFLIHITLSFSSVQGLGGEVSATCCLNVRDLGCWLWRFSDEERVGDGTAQFHQVGLVVRLQHDVHMAFFVRQLGNVNKARAHSSFVRLNDFLDRLLANARLNYRGTELPFRGHVGDTLKELLLGLESLVALSFAQLLETISDDNFV